MKAKFNKLRCWKENPYVSRKAAHGGFLCLVGLMAIILVFIPEMAEAQCSMCRAVTNSNQLTDDAFTIGNGLNNAIVYLMLTPYVMAAIFFYAFFRKPITAWIKSKLSI